MADWEYPTLGFDPLPGEPMTILALRDDARAYGQRMTEEAVRLRRLARPVDWAGQAADAYSAGLDHLPRDLQRCGQAFLDLAGALERYHERFVDARREAQDLERRATEARAGLEVTEPVAGLDDELGAVLREAHGFAERFDESVDDIARAIRRLTAFAPDEPLFGVLRRWAANVFGLSLTDNDGDPSKALFFLAKTSYRSTAERGRAVQAWAKGLNDEQWEALIASSPESVGSTAGIPYDRRFQANRLLVERSLAETRASLAEARRRGDGQAAERLQRRERSLQKLLAERDGKPRQFLLFDNAGDGRVAEVFGDLGTAANVAMMVPGMANTLDNYSNLADNTDRLHRAAIRLGRGKKAAGTVATVAWLGYDTPGFSGVLSDAEAKVGASQLRDFDDGLLLRKEVVTTVVAHSYGSLVTGTALRSGLHVDNVAVVGSPGIGVENIKDLHLPPGTDFYAGRAPLDPVAWSEWHGADPTDPRFGGRRFETGDATAERFPAGHSAYFQRDSDSLKNLARIVTDQDDHVSEVDPSLLDRANMDVDRWQETHKGVPAGVTAAVDTGQEVVDKVGDVAGDVEKVAEREARKVGKWLGDKWPG